MFTRLTFTQAMGQLLAVAIDWMVGLLTPPRQASGVRTPQMTSSKHHNGRTTSLMQRPETPQGNSQSPEPPGTSSVIAAGSDASSSAG